MSDSTIQSDSGLEAARRLFGEGRFQDAVEALSGSEGHEELELRAQGLVALGRYEEAIECYREMERLHPGDPDVLAELAAFLTARGRYGEAVESYDRALELRPGDAAIQRDRALALRLSGEREAAVEAYDAALEIDPDEAETWAAKADLLIELNRFGEAMECLTRASDAPSGGFSAADWTSRGYGMARAGALAEAIQCFDRALKNDPAAAQAHLGKASVQQQQGDLEAALASCIRAVEIRPEDARGWAEKGNVLAIQGRFENAIESFEAAVERDPADKTSWANRGYCRAELGRYSEALRDYSEAIALDPGYAYAWEGKGRCLGSLQRPAEAIEAYKRALTLDPDLVWANNNLGWVLASVGHHEEALAYYYRSIELGPSEAIPVINLANSLIELERVEEARELLERAREQVRDEDRGTVLERLAGVFSEQIKDSAKALELFEEAEELSTLDEGVQLSIAELLIRLGRHGEGRMRTEAVVQRTEEPQLRMLTSFLLFASHSLEGDAQRASGYFEEFLDWAVRAAGGSEGGPVAGGWSFEGFADSILASACDSLTRFVLLGAIDLQTGQLSAPSLARLRQGLPLVEPRQMPRTSLPPEEEQGILASLSSAFDKFRRRLSSS